MQKPKVEKINLPYASTVASYFGDQGSGPGSSFLGRFFKGGGSGTMTQTQKPTVTPKPTLPFLPQVSKS